MTPDEIEQLNRSIIDRLFNYQHYMLRFEATYFHLDINLATKVKSIIFNPILTSLQNRLVTSVDPIEKQIITSSIIHFLDTLILQHFEFNDNVPKPVIYTVFDNLFSNNNG